MKRPIPLVTFIFLLLYISLSAQETQIFAFDGEFADLFGHSVAIDGEYAVVGAPLHGGFYSDYAGAAYVFQLIANVWTPVKKLTPPWGGEPGDHFGYSVDISGNYIVVGAHRTDDGEYGDVGAAYVYSGSGSSWTLRGSLHPHYGMPGDEFGKSVGISGTTVIAGAPGDDTHGNQAGAAYIFEYHYGGWIQAAKLFASDASASDVFGAAVAIDHYHAVVGAPASAGVPGHQSGAVYVFSPDHYGLWSQTTRLTNSNAGYVDEFGFSVDIDGNYIIAGAPLRYDKAGSAYIFNGSGAYWTEVDELIADDGAPHDKFGHDVGITSGYALVGAWFDDDDGSESGSMYLYQESGASWPQVNKFTASDAQAGDRFGISVDIDGVYTIAGAYYHTVNHSDDGAAYIYGPDLLGLACVSSISLNGIIEAGEYMATDLIEADGIILSPKSVLFSCSNVIELNGGFEVQSGAALTISMDGCP